MKTYFYTMRLPIILIILLILSACAIEGGVAPTAEPGPLPSPTPVVVTATASVAAQATAEPTPVPETGLRIGLEAAPPDLLPYHTDATDERTTAALSELLFPAPLLALNYNYTNTGVLEQLPSFENGDVSVGSVQLYLDSSGFITTTVTEVVTSVQQLSVVFRWNRNLRWSDGTPVTAADSVFAYELAQQVSLGAEADSRLALLERYELVDEYTTRAMLRPNYTDPAYITSFWTPLPRHLLADIEPQTFFASDYVFTPVGYGPYQVVRHDAEQIRLERNPYYFGPPPSVEGITFVFTGSDREATTRAVADGSLDLAAIEQPDELLFAALKAQEASGEVVLNAMPDAVWEHLDFNLDVALFQDIRMRRAIAHAINRQEMVDELLGGYGRVLESWVMPEQWANAPLDQLTRYPYDPATANLLLDESGLVDSDGDGVREREGQPITITLLTTDNAPVRLAAAERIREDLGAIGLTVEIEALAPLDLYSSDGPLFRREFELALFAWIATPDPRGWERWSCAGVPNAANGFMGNNFAGWCFFEADQAIRTATSALSREQRQAAYLRQQQLLTQELPILPLFQRVSVVISSPTLQGVVLDPTAPLTWNVGQWRRK
jgi:peptide/nickel transport system substrate-binding protein